MTSTEVVDASGDAEPSTGKKRVRIAIPTTHRQHRAELVFMALVKPHRDVDEPGNAEPETGSKRSKGGPLNIRHAKECTVVLAKPAVLVSRRKRYRRYGRHGLQALPRTVESSLRLFRRTRKHQTGPRHGSMRTRR